MKFWTIVYKNLPAHGMAIFPFIFIKSQSRRTDLILINHEKIHLQQQIEMLVVPFYVLYLLNYLVNLVRYRTHHLAYLNIIFEREAYHQESDLSYLAKRPFWAWINLKNVKIS